MSVPTQTKCTTSKNIRKGKAWDIERGKLGRTAKGSYERADWRKKSCGKVYTETLAASVATGDRPKAKERS